MIGPLTVRFRTAVKVNEVTKTTRGREGERERIGLHWIDGRKEMK
jgi:hypothetical protein